MHPHSSHARLKSKLTFTGSTLIPRSRTGSFSFLVASSLTVILIVMRVSADTATLVGAAMMLAGWYGVGSEADDV